MLVVAVAIVVVVVVMIVVMVVVVVVVVVVAVVVVVVVGARCSSVVKAFAHGAMGRRIDPSWGGPIELFLVLASAPRLV